MKNAFCFSMFALVIAVFCSCTKEGPIGPAGPAGSNGTNGADGKDGNTNVATYLFTDSADIAWDLDNEIVFPYVAGGFTIPDSIRESGLVLVYTKISFSGTWYAVPGLGLSAGYTTRLFITSTSLCIAAHNPDGSNFSGTSLPLLSAVKIVLVPASTIMNMRQSGQTVDFDDYEATMEMLGEGI